jgi:alpha-2-macroglobulin
VATGSRKSQLRRRLSLALLVALIVGAFAAARPDAQYEPSGYQPLAGEPFFLLSDKTYGSSDFARVRLEITSKELQLQAAREYGGADVVLYRVPRPIAFLQGQKNLRRITLDAHPAEEGLANTLLHLWDRWVIASRRAWRAVFTSGARGEVLKHAPELGTKPGWDGPTTFRHPPQFKPIPGFELMAKFRYPVHHAAPIKPPSDVKLAGSSSEFVTSSPGNVFIPLGKLEPGLYIVEAFIGGYRATTMVFASDTMAITKASSQEMVVWTAHRSTGAAVRGVKVAWTDGVGVLQSGKTDARGLVQFAREAPERSYVFGQDRDGGVFISENFYYDSEIYDTKLYAVTDRPLYRPGDEVFVKLFGRDFQSARLSRPVAAGDVTLTAYDPAGAPVANQSLKLVPETGGETSFRLPENSTAGGYELRFKYRDAMYSAAFRVAEYQKPHFEITLVPDKADFKIGEPVGGKLQLHYPDGTPVRSADVQLTVRSQQLTTVDGELGYYGQFPIRLDAETLTTNERGEAAFTLPAATEPSRYLLTALATDGAAYRVKTTRELLIERGQSSFTLRTEQQFSAPNAAVTFAFRAAGPNSGSTTTKPVSWEWVRLEDRKRNTGTLTSADSVQLTFPEGGSYTVHLRDERDNIVAAAPHWVTGGGMRPPVGTIEIVPSKERYQSGEMAELLITFPTAVDDALVTLERDRVEAAATLQRPQPWARLNRTGPTEWRALVPIRDTFAPNITFSVVYVKDGEYVFQNQGLTVAQPTIDIALRTNKEVYAPGERVDMQLTTTVAGKPVAATLAVGVVDEMVFALQPEIAPHIYDFFFHARRNNVRTAASLDFISYDLAAPRTRRASEPQTVNERRVKVLERPRRDDVDTAFWQPVVRTDASGKATLSFTMPDALTRWRITARGMVADGTVGQKVATVRTDKELYATWTSPNWMRAGDIPVATLALFNQTSGPQAVEIDVEGPGISRTQRVTLRPGANYVEQRLAGTNGDGAIAVAIKRNGAVVDRLETKFSRVPTAWPSQQSVFVDASQAAPRLDLPADARDVRVTFTMSAAEEFDRVAENLMEYPYGCIEQTASRMIPLALALESVPTGETRMRDRLSQQLNGARLRLAYMAGVNGTFAWWGHSTREDPFLTAYAFYADWLASRALHIDLPPEQWNRLLDVYREGSASLPPVHRALVVHFMQEMKLPVRTLAEGLLEDLGKNSGQGSARSFTRSVRRHAADSVLIGGSEDPLAEAFALVLADRVARRESVTPPADLMPAIEAAYQALAASGLPAADALLLANGHLASTEVRRLLGTISAEMPTLERGLALAWVRASFPTQSANAATPQLAAPWMRTVTPGGAVVWRWPSGRALPTTVQLNQPASPGTRAVVQFESTVDANARLATSLQRRLYRVVKGEEGAFKLEEVDETTRLSTKELYLDEVTVTPNGGLTLRYALLEVPLPPGASVDSTTWGINFPGAEDKLEGLERARHEPTRFGYAVPVDGVTEPIRLRHLVRFAQQGTFTLPRARLYRMYQPAAKAIEAGAATRQVEVR